MQITYLEGGALEQCSRLPKAMRVVELAQPFGDIGPKIEVEDAHWRTHRRPLAGEDALLLLLSSRAIAMGRLKTKLMQNKYLRKL